MTRRQDLRRPVFVAGSFDLLARHFAFDDARVGSQSAGWVKSLEEFTHDVELAGGMVSSRRGKIARLGDGSARDTQCSYEGHPVGVGSGVDRCFPHDRVDRVVAAQAAPDFLLDKVRDFDRSTIRGPR